MSTANHREPLRALRHQHGAAAVELAFLLPVLLLIFAGIVEFGRTFWYYDALAKATRDGARTLSIEPKDTILTGVTKAKTIVVNAANAAGVSPALTAAEVSVTCLDASFSAVACANGTAPENIKVAISGYTIDIGASIPFFVSAGATTTYDDVPLAPHTVMRYML